MRTVNIRQLNQYGRKVTINLKFDSKGNLINKRSLAVSSLVGWGEWQTSKKIKSRYGDCWTVTTAGHGGFILVTQEKLGYDLKPVLSSDDFGHKGYWKSYDLKKWYVYEFEEDCEWAILCYIDPIFYEDYNRYWMKSCTIKGKTLDKYVIDTLKSWNPEILKHLIHIPR